MSIAARVIPESLATRAQWFFWTRPDWWTIALCLLAWCAMLPHMLHHPLHHSVHHASSDSLHRMSFDREVMGWTLMVVAMMLPFHLGAVKHAASRSLWARRHRAIAGFLAGYLTPWVLLGVVVAGVRQLEWAGSPIAPTIAFAAAALWQLTPAYRRGLIDCHVRLPLAPAGWPANRDCLYFGSRVGVACVTSCWPLMTACALSGHSMIAMVGGFAVALAECKRFRHRKVILVGALLLLAAYSAIPLLSTTLDPSSSQTTSSDAP